MDEYTGTLPGTAKTQAETGEKGFAKIQVLLDATGGLSLSQVCTVTGLEASTIQNWVKRGWVAHPKGKRYEELHIARILIINALKECIKLEHIAKLMTYLNGKAKDGSEAIIKESILYNYLCESMRRSGHMGDSSKGGVETVVESVTKDYNPPNPQAREKLRKTLTLMMFACVCTDVKRRTEAMMGQILKELDNPEAVITQPKPAAAQPQKPAAAAVPAAAVPAAEPPAAAEPKAKTPPRPVPPVMQETEIPVAARTTATPQPVNPIRITLDEPDETEQAHDDAAQTRKTISQALREWDISSVEKIIIDHDEEARNNAGTQAETKKPANRPWYIRKNK